MKRVFLFTITFLWAIGLYAASYTPASVPKPKTQGQEYYVANPDAIIPDSDEVWLNRCASLLNQQTHVEMCVVALSSIGDAEAFDFAYELYQRWGIGREGQNTGVLILFVMDSHDIRIMTGVGMEGILPDARCSQIIHDDMIPAFRKGDYGGGLCLGALRIYEICTNGEAPEELLNTRSVTNRGQYASDDETDDDAWVFLVAFFIVLIIIVWILIRNNKGGGYSGGHSGNGGGPVIFSGGRGGFSGGGFSGGSWGGGSTMGGGAGGKW